jgi:hypothetical protein
MIDEFRRITSIMAFGNEREWSGAEGFKYRSDVRCSVDAHRQGDDGD